eukprot:scaffold431_cov334-Pavlova_lutheri.AAC.24
MVSLDGPGSDPTTTSRVGPRLLPPFPSPARPHGAPRPEPGGGFRVDGRSYVVVGSTEVDERSPPRPAPRRIAPFLSGVERIHGPRGRTGWRQQRRGRNEWDSGIPSRRVNDPPLPSRIHRAWQPGLDNQGGQGSPEPPRRGMGDPRNSREE